MKRGDLVTVAFQGDKGKPRPALVVQSDYFAAHSTVALCPLTSTILDPPLFRITMEPTAANGLAKTSRVMVDKVHTISRDKVVGGFGTLSPNS